MPDGTHRFFAQTEDDTIKLGTFLAGFIAPDDLILLKGELGTGKSCLARALLRSWLKDPDLEVPSPTYLLVLPYSGDVNQEPRKALHADLYRIEAEGDVVELGLFENPGAVVLVEWPERAPDLFKQADMIVHIKIPPDGAGRNFMISSEKYSQELTRFPRQREPGHG